MRTGASIDSVVAGAVDIVLPFRKDLTQQHGFLHGGIVTSVLDSACGYSALTLLPPGKEVLTVEFKVNLLRPAVGECFIVKAQVVSAGRRVLVVSGTAYRQGESENKPIAMMLATMIAADNDSSGR